MAVNIYDDDFLVRLHEMKQPESTLFQSKRVAGAPVIAGSAEAIIEEAILLTLAIRMWEIDRSVQFSAEQRRIEADEELIEKILVNIVNAKKAKVFEEISDPEIQTLLEEEFDKLLREAQEATKELLATMRSISERFIKSLHKNSSFGLLADRLGFDRVEYGHRMIRVARNLECRAIVRQHPALSEFVLDSSSAERAIFYVADDLHKEIVRAGLDFNEAHDNETTMLALRGRLELQFHHRQLQIAAGEANLGKTVSSAPFEDGISEAKVVAASAPAYEGEVIPVAQAVDSSDLPYAEVYSAEAPRPQPGGAAMVIDEEDEKMIWGLARDLDQEITRAGIGFNENDSPEVAQASFEARLEMRNAQQQMVIANGEAYRQASSAVASFNENPTVVAAAHQPKRFQVPTPKPYTPRNNVN